MMTDLTQQGFTGRMNDKKNSSHCSRHPAVQEPAAAEIEHGRASGKHQQTGNIEIECFRADEGGEQIGIHKEGERAVLNAAMVRMGENMQPVIQRAGAEAVGRRENLPAIAVKAAAKQGKIPEAGTTEED